MIWKSYEIKEQIKIEKLYSLFFRHYDKDFNFSGEMHDFWEVVYVADGEVIISADENIHCFKSGDIIFHKPLELHKFTVTGENGASMLVFSFEMTGEYCKNFENKVFSLDKYHRGVLKSFIEFLEHEIKKRPDIKCRETSPDTLPYFENDGIFLQTVSNYISRIVLMLINGTGTFNKIKTYETELFKNSLKIMNKNLSSQLSVSELSKKLNVSESTLKRLFIKYAGMSVHKYFLTLKIKEATLLLKNGIRVSEVSEMLGFSSQSYFSVVYKRETGNNPSQI